MRPLSIDMAMRKGYETERTKTMLRVVRIRMIMKGLHGLQKRVRVENLTERIGVRMYRLGGLPKQYPASYPKPKFAIQALPRRPTTRSLAQARQTQTSCHSSTVTSA